MPRATVISYPALVWHITDRLSQFQKARIVSRSKQDRAQTRRDETVAGLSRSRPAARDLSSKQN
jgi:hypothetical protein